MFVLKVILRAQRILACQFSLEGRLCVFLFLFFFLSLSCHLNSKPLICHLAWKSMLQLRFDNSHWLNIVSQTARNFVASLLCRNKWILTMVKKHRQFYVKQIGVRYFIFQYQPPSAKRWQSSLTCRAIGCQTQ